MLHCICMHYAMHMLLLHACTAYLYMLSLGIYICLCVYIYSVRIARMQVSNTGRESVEPQQVAGGKARIPYAVRLRALIDSVAIASTGADGPHRHLRNRVRAGARATPVRTRPACPTSACGRLARGELSSTVSAQPHSMCGAQGTVRISVDSSS